MDFGSTWHLIVKPEAEGGAYDDWLERSLEKRWCVVGQGGKYMRRKSLRPGKVCI